MISYLLTALGVLLILLVVYDVYATILDARSRAGPISETLNRGVWSLARRIAFRLPRQRRHRFLNTIGPLLLPALIAVYIGSLVSGFALIYFPRMPAHFNVAPEAVSPVWIESLYFSGTTLTTVGYGDIAPQTPLGQALATLLMVTGYGIIAVPTGIVTVELGRAASEKLQSNPCVSCGAPRHDVDAQFCKHCGERLPSSTV